MYILDTNVFVVMEGYYPDRFPSFWTMFNDLAEDGAVRSVREVRKEITFQCREEHVKSWATSHTAVFPIPTEAECKFVAKLLKQKKYQGFIKKQNLLKGFPVADPFVIAAGKALARCVVTQEKDSGGARIPTACREFDVRCINLDEFLGEVGFSF